MIQLAERHCLTVTDGHEPALDARKDHAGYASRVTHSELIRESFVAAEDLLDRQFLHQILGQLAKTNFNEVEVVARRRLLDGQPALQQICDGLPDQKVTKDHRGEMLNQLKTSPFGRVDSSVIVPAATSILYEIAKYLADIRQLRIVLVLPCVCPSAWQVN